MVPATCVPWPVASTAGPTTHFEPQNAARRIGGAYVEVRMRSIDACVHHCNGTPLRNEIEERDPNSPDLVTDRATEAITTRFGKGPVSAKIQAHVITAIV